MSRTRTVGKEMGGESQAFVNDSVRLWDRGYDTSIHNRKVKGDQWKGCKKRQQSKQVAKRGPF